MTSVLRRIVYSTVKRTLGMHAMAWHLALHRRVFEPGAFWRMHVKQLVKHARCHAVCLGETLEVCKLT